MSRYCSPVTTPDAIRGGLLRHKTIRRHGQKWWTRKEFEAKSSGRFTYENGLWLSLVERLVRDQEAVGSNPTSPIKMINQTLTCCRMSWHRLRSFSRDFNREVRRQ